MAVEKNIVPTTEVTSATFLSRKVKGQVVVRAGVRVAYVVSCVHRMITLCAMARVRVAQL